MVFYRKYRPQTIEELDSSDVRESLSSILSQDPPAHALLFTGPKGLGKTSSARIVAKVINCTTSEKKRKNGYEPCGKCGTCVSITEGTNMDILEIDAASNRGIDEIRDLKEKIRLTPLSSKMKVYIIDEVHMLTTEAFNALLKTLEEPPDHAMFILCTTEQQKLPATILSRCFHIAFKKATEDELVRSFMRIAKRENIKVDNDTLKFIASISDGSFRDGVKILEEMSFLTHSTGSEQGKKEISKKLIEEKYNVVSLNRSVEEMIRFLIEGEVRNALLLVTQLTEQGIDIKFFTQSLIENIHGKMLEEINNGKNADRSVKSLIVMAQALSKAYQDTKYAVIPQLPLELAIIELGSAQDDFVDVTQIINTDDSISVASLRKQVGNIKKISAMYGTAAQKPVAKEELMARDQGISLLHTSNSGVTKEWLESLWRNLITEMKLYNHTIAGVLRGCRIGGFDQKQLIIETNFKFHKERLDDANTKSELARVAKLLTGKDIRVEVQLKSRD